MADRTIIVEIIVHYKQNVFPSGQADRLYNVLCFEHNRVGFAFQFKSWLRIALLKLFPNLLPLDIGTYALITILAKGDSF